MAMIPSTDRTRPLFLIHSLAILFYAVEAAITEEVSTVCNLEATIWNKVKADWAFPLLTQFLSHLHQRVLNMGRDCLF